jgi:hypothetical protein
MSKLTYGILEKRLQAAITLHDKVKFLEEFVQAPLGLDSVQDGSLQRIRG